MKRIIWIMMMLLCVCASCLAEETINFTRMTTEELHQLIDEARMELSKRELLIGDSVTILEAENVTISLTGEYDALFDEYIELKAVVLNDSEKNVGITLDKVALNGWTVYGGGPNGVDAGKRGKGEFTFSLVEADLHSPEEVEDIEFVISLYDLDTFVTFYTTDLIHLQMQ